MKVMTPSKQCPLKTRRLFCGDHNGIQRFDQYKHPMNKKFVDVMISATWFVKELNFSADKACIRSIDKGYLDIYFSNIAFQTLADSAANRFLDNVLSGETTSPELEATLKYQAFQELNHSLSYAHNVTEVSDNATELLDKYLSNPNIIDRLKIELGSFNKDIPTDKTSDEYKRFIFDVVITQYVLESMRFMVSFLYTFKLDSILNNSLKGSVSNIKLILNDELIHCSIFSWLIKTLINNEDEGFSQVYTREEIDQIIVDKFQAVYDSELYWFGYLSSIKQIPGFTKGGISEFLSDIGYHAMVMVGVGKSSVGFGQFLKGSNDIISFFDKNKLINGIKTLAQEANNKSYNIATLNQDKIPGAMLEKMDVSDIIKNLIKKEMEDQNG